MREIAVITGASAGIGRATAREFAKRGSKIALLARGRAGLEAARREVEELGAEALCAAKHAIQGFQGQPQPVGAIYQPEVAARAIWKAAHSSRKQWIVGAPAYQAIEADKFISALLDRYLARGSIEAQQGERLVPGRRDNLFEPLDELQERGAHGRFDAQSRESSPLLWASGNRWWIAAGAALAVGAGLVAARLRGERNGHPTHQ